MTNLLDVVGSRVKLKVRIFVLVAVPILGLLVASAMVLVDRSAMVADMNRTTSLIVLSDTVSNYVHALQAEAGATAASFGKAVTGLGALRASTDAAREVVMARLATTNLGGAGSDLTQVLERGLRSSGLLPDIRAAVDAGSIEAGAMNTAYSSAIGELLQFSIFAGRNITNPQVAAEAQAYAYVLQAAEFSSAARANAAVGFGAGLFTPDLVARVNGFVAQQKTYEALIRVFATPEQRQFYQDTYSGAPVTETARMIDVMNAAGPNVKIETVTQDAWLRANADRLDLYRHVEARFRDDLMSVTGSIAGGASTDLLIAGALTIVLCMTSLSLAFFTIRGITGPMRMLVKTMTELAAGKTDVTVDGTERQDELGEMARAVQVFKVNAERVRDLSLADQARSGEASRRQAAMAELLASLKDTVQNAASGDFSTQIEFNGEDSDLRGVAESVNKLLDTVDSGLREQSKALSALANADLTYRVEGDYLGAFGALKESTNSVVDSLGKILMRLRETSGSLKAATGDILSGANDLAERTTRQAAAIEETSAAIEQLHVTVTENARRAAQASRMSRQASEAAEHTGQVMQRANEAMETISTSSQRISNIIGMIDDIAFQTNLLALNASVEAARAGDAGKGFAVVAVEVRRLAQSAAQASSEVKELIEQSAIEVTAGGRLVAEATTQLVGMVEQIQQSAELVADISAASQNQASSIAQVSTAVREMDEMTQHNAALVEETNAAIEQTESQANDLDGIVDLFRIGRATPSTATRPRDRHSRRAA